MILFLDFAWLGQTYWDAEPMHRIGQDFPFIGFCCQGYEGHAVSIKLPQGSCIGLQFLTVLLARLKI